MIVYFGGCTWYYATTNLNSEEDKMAGKPFYIYFNMNGNEKKDLGVYFKYLVKSCYYISTTVNIIGYGELYPMTNEEKLLTMFFELLGLTMALYFLG